MNKDENGFLIYETTKDDILLASDILSKRFNSGFNLNNSTVYNRKESRLAGIIGEIVFQKMYPNAIKSPDKDITYDFISDGKKIDIKCKYRKVAPRDNFEASFFAYQGTNNFDVDVYVFMSTKDNFEIVWVCGYIGKKKCLNSPEAKLWRAGETDERNGMVFRKDTWCLPYSSLRKF